MVLSAAIHQNTFLYRIIVMANTFLKNNTITVNEKKTVLGSTGTNDKIILGNAALGSSINSNVETIQFAGKFIDYQFAVQGNRLLVNYQLQAW